MTSDVIWTMVERRARFQTRLPQDRLPMLADGAGGFARATNGDGGVWSRSNPGGADGNASSKKGRVGDCVTWEGDERLGGSGIGKQVGCFWSNSKGSVWNRCSKTQVRFVEKFRRMFVRLRYKVRSEFCKEHKRVSCSVWRLREACAFYRRRSSGWKREWIRENERTGASYGKKNPLGGGHTVNIISRKGKIVKWNECKKKIGLIWLFDCLFRWQTIIGRMI